MNAKEHKKTPRWIEFIGLFFPILLLYSLWVENFLANSCGSATMAGFKRYELPLLCQLQDSLFWDGFLAMPDAIVSQLSSLIYLPYIVLVIVVNSLLLIVNRSQGFRAYISRFFSLHTKLFRLASGFYIGLGTLNFLLFLELIFIALFAMIGMIIMFIPIPAFYLLSLGYTFVTSVLLLSPIVSLLPFYYFYRQLDGHFKKTVRLGFIGGVLLTAIILLMIYSSQQDAAAYLKSLR